MYLYRITFFDPRDRLRQITDSYIWSYSQDDADLKAGMLAKRINYDGLPFITTQLIVEGKPVKKCRED